MDMLKTLPLIAAEDLTPLVRQFIDVVRQQGEQIERLTVENQTLRDEVARLKKHAPRPKVKPNSKPPPPSSDGPRAGKRPGSAKRRKTETLEIHETCRIAPTDRPDDATFIGVTTYTVQDLRITCHTIRYELERWETPDGTVYAGQLPASAQDGHFGPTLRSFILYQYHHGHVTQPRLLIQLREYGIDISAGQLHRLLTEGHEAFHAEKSGMLTTTLDVSPYVQVDDTGARHQGQNGYCTYIGTPWMSWFASTESKSRLNFLKLLRAGRTTYVLVPEALTYMAERGLPKTWLTVLRTFTDHAFFDDAAWQAFLTCLGMEQPAHIRIATEGAVLGTLLCHGVAPDLVVLSDGAGQFNLFLHALCWIHAERSLTKLIPVTDRDQAALDAAREEFWQYYAALHAYQQAPDDVQKILLTWRFERMTARDTGYEALDAVLRRLATHQTELLRVLDHPEVPVHNNGSEQAIREYVTRRKISGGTRSEAGRNSRDTFTSLKQTCRKVGISFWQYLLDRLGKQETIPPLADLIRQHALKPG
jgi:hypothetical protein